MVYQIIDKIKSALLDESPFVTTVTEGDIFDVDIAKKTLFPLSHIILNNSTHNGNTIQFNISVILMDIIDENKVDVGNKVDIWNTQHLVAVRVLNKLNRGDLRDGTIELLNNPSFEFFTERFENNLAGVTMTFDVIVPNDVSIC
jgi:hypothetical protein